MLKNFPSNFPKGIRNLWSREEGHKNEDSERLASAERHNDENWERLAAKECEIFSYETLLAATDNFDHLNEHRNSDNFRSFYKGKLEDGREVEVERWLSETWEGGRKEFIKEAELLSSLQHPSVVKLFGYCDHNDEFLLVYQYLPTNLQQLLYSATGREQLNWTRRYEIIQGTIKGLNYLHGGSQNGIIIHGDLNTRNILLDHELKPIISGFCGGRHPEFSSFRDTTRYSCAADFKSSSSNPYRGHMAPEFLARGKMSVKTDVYGFGVLLLELITGKSFASEGMIYYKFRGLTDWAYKLHEKSRSLELLDPTLAGSVVTEQVTKCITVALLCIHGAPHSRPRMSDVLTMLPRDQGVMEIQIDRERSTSSDDNKVEELVNFGSEILHDIPMYSPSNSIQMMKEDSHSNSSRVHAQDDHQRQEDETLKKNFHDMAIHIMDSTHIIEEDSHSNSFKVPAQDGREGQEDASLKKKIDAQNCQRFSYEALHGATNGFASQNLLGHGGFGLVYKGKLDDGREIAVKKSSNVSKQQREALITEVELLSSLKHPNVVKLFGYCADNNEFLLVYEYVPNKSLDKLLFGPNGREKELDWRRTYGIIIGIAKGLSYLHGNPQNCIIHRDIKPGNILLDHKWVAKISDFGISRLFEEDQTHVYTRIIGTWGYIAPEYLDHTRVSIKTDVYSFGILVLELISGRRYSFMPPPEDNALGLLDWAYKLFKAGRISEIMDPALANSAVTEQVNKCIKMGLLCTQGHPNSRPDMERCVFILAGFQDQSEITISRPGVLGYRGYPSGPLSALVEATQNQGTNTLDGMSVDEHEGKDSSSNLSQIMLEELHM